MTLIETLYHEINSFSFQLLKVALKKFCNIFDTFHYKNTENE